MRSAISAEVSTGSGGNFREYGGTIKKNKKVFEGRRFYKISALQHLLYILVINNNNNNKI